MRKFRLVKSLKPLGQIQISKDPKVRKMPVKSISGNEDSTFHSGP